MEKPFDLFDSSIPEYVKKEIKDGIQNRLVNNIDLNQKIRVRALFFSSYCLTNQFRAFK